MYLGKGAFNPKMDRLEALLGLGDNLTKLAEEVPGSIGTQKSETFYGTSYIGTGPTYAHGRVNGFQVIARTIYVTDLTGLQKDSIQKKNTTDSILYRNLLNQRVDSMLIEMK